MENIETVEVTAADGTIETCVIIDRGDGNFTSMPKSVYDEQLAKNEAAPK